MTKPKDLNTAAQNKEQEKKPRPEHRQTYTGRRSVKEPIPDSNVLIANTMTAAKKKEVSVVGQRIKYFREEKGIEQKALAKELGIIANAISNWEHGRSRPDIALLPKICAALGVSLDELFDTQTGKKNDTSDNVSIDVTSSGKRSAQKQLSKSAEALLDNYYQLSVPHQFTIDAMIEKLLEAEDMAIYEQVIEETEFTKQLAAGFDPGIEFDDKGETVYIYREKHDPRADCIFSVSGDSMEPDFHDGDKVFVQRYPNCGTLQPGDIGAFISGNETYIKEYQLDGLHSLNKKYRTMKFSDDNNVYMIGRVLGVVEPAAFLTFEDTVRYERAKENIEERKRESIIE